MDWVHSHLELQLLQRVYIPRSPGHAAWSIQEVTEGFSRATVASACIVQSLLRRAQRCRARSRSAPALQLERCAAREIYYVPLRADEIRMMRHILDIVSNLEEEEENAGGVQVSYGGERGHRRRGGQLGRER